MAQYTKLWNCLPAAFKHLLPGDVCQCKHSAGLDNSIYLLCGDSALIPLESLSLCFLFPRVARSPAHLYHPTCAVHAHNCAWENNMEHVAESGKLVWESVEQGEVNLNIRSEIPGHSTICVNHCTCTTGHLNFSSRISYMNVSGLMTLHEYVTRSISLIAFCEENNANHMSIKKLSLPLRSECSTLA